MQVKLKDYPAAFMAYERAAGLAPGIAGYRLREAMMMFQVRPMAVFHRISRIANGSRDDHIPRRRHISPYRHHVSSHRHHYFPRRHASSMRRRHLSPSLPSVPHARLCGQLDRVEDATRVLQGLVRKYPNYSEAHAALAAVLWKEDKRGAAEEEYSEASLQEPRFKNLMSACPPPLCSMLHTTPVCGF